MVQSSVILLVTMDTKEQEAAALQLEMLKHNISVEILDIGLGQKNQNLTGSDKIKLMNQVAIIRGEELKSLLQHGAKVIVGLGGGTGSQIVLKIFRQLEMSFPKLLVTTLPFDPRDAVADNSIIIIPTLCDVQGMNPLLRDLFSKVAALISGLANNILPDEQTDTRNAIAITALGITNQGVLSLQKRIEEKQLDTIIFHSNGYGGAALVRAIDEQIVAGLIDFTPHELTRMQIAGANIEMPRRFTACVEKKLPMVLVPGGLNFIGLGPYEGLENNYKNRPVFRHSELFTHVGVLPDEMVAQTKYLMSCLNMSELDIQILVPMQGFSSTDRQDRELYSPQLRQIFLDIARRLAGPRIGIREYPNLHIEDAEFAEICSDTLVENMN